MKAQITLKIGDAVCFADVTVDGEINCSDRCNVDLRQLFQQALAQLGNTYCPYKCGDVNGQNKHK